MNTTIEFDDTGKMVPGPAAPITFRLPKVGEADPYFTCNRSWWNERILPTERNGNKPPIRSISTAPAKVRGPKGFVRLIVFASAVDYLNRLSSSENS